MYVSLAEIQIQHEEDIARNPISKGNEDISLTPTEVLYQVRTIDIVNRLSSPRVVPL